MALAASKREWLNTIAPLIAREGKDRGYKIVSTVIAQAICESAWGTSWIAKDPYYNYFGMKCGGSWKGRSVSAATKEEYTPGTLTNITANFRAYDSMESGVQGYYDFIDWSRYKNLHDAADYKEYAQMLKDDGYATSSTYVNTLCTLVEDYNLTDWDDVEFISYDISDLDHIPVYGEHSDTVKVWQYLVGLRGSQDDGKFGPITQNATSTAMKFK